MYTTTKETRVFLTRTCGQFEYGHNYWKNSLINFLQVLARRNGQPLFDLELEESGGVNVVFPLEPPGNAWFRGVLAEPPGWISKVPESQQIRCSDSVIELIGGLHLFIYGRETRLLVIDSSTSVAVAVRHGDPTAFETLYIWKSLKNQLGMAGKTVSTTKM